MFGVMARYSFRFNGSIFDAAFLRAGFFAVFVAVFVDLAVAFGFAVIRADFLPAFDFFFAAFAISTSPSGAMPGLL
jgi:hypothetical protein